MSEKNTAAPKSLYSESFQKWMNSVVVPAFVENQDKDDDTKILSTDETEKIATFIRNTNAFMPRGSPNNDMRVDYVFKYIYMRLNHPEGDDIEEKNKKFYKAKFYTAVNRRRFNHELNSVKEILKTKLPIPKEKILLLTNVGNPPDSPVSPKRERSSFWSSQISVNNKPQSSTLFKPPTDMAYPLYSPASPERQMAFPTRMADSQVPSSPMSSTEDGFVATQPPQLYRSQSQEATLKNLSQPLNGKTQEEEEEEKTLVVPSQYGGKRGKKTRKRQNKKGTQRQRKHNRKTANKHKRYIK